jgi:hypothetical protein
LAAGLEEISPNLRNSLQTCLRVCDEAIALPSAGRSTESGAFKNVVFRLSGADGNLSPDIFSSNWFAGVSVVVVPTDHAEALMRNPARRTAALKRVAEVVQSEMADSDVQVGPELEGDETDRDTNGWTPGFDSSSCCVGLFSARQSRAPEAQITGMDRVHNAYYLLCKAGGGVAAQTFHSRLCSALSSGKTLDECFAEGASPGAQALRRVTLAAARNRQRILAAAANVMGFAMLDTIPDNAASPSAPHRACIPSIDVTYNSLRKVEGLPRSTWQYSSGCVDASCSHGLLTSSNIAEGFVAFTTSNDDFRLNLRNEAHNCVPFVTQRLSTTRELTTMAADAHKKAIVRNEAAHPDDAFIKERFVWKPWRPKNGTPLGVLIEPTALWGSHAPENFLANWARELGVAACKTFRLSPEVVCVASLEPAKLRAAVKRAMTDLA